MILLNDKEIKPTIFPDKTSQVWNIEIPEQDEVLITWLFENEEEFLHVAQLNHLLNSYFKLVSLKLPYLPYARQDKLVTNNSTFALHTFSRLLNSLYFKEIIILDPHNPTKTAQLINNTRFIYPVNQVYKVYYDLECDVVCYPDKGAKEKYTNIYGFIDTVYCDKVRNQSTGAIESIELIGEVKDKKVLIVDDLCDAGGTFIRLSKKLLDAGAKEVYLFVTHGLFTKGIECLLDAGIKRVFGVNHNLSTLEQK